MNVNKPLIDEYMKIQKSVTATIAIAATLFAIVLLNNRDIPEGKEYALYHYSSIDEDSLKYEAAKFLIDNMQYHYSVNNIEGSSEEWEKWRRETDSILRTLLNRYPFDAIPRDTINAIQAIRDTLLAIKNIPEMAFSDSAIRDTEFITAEFLIRHIDNAFNVWHNSKFAESLSFEEFKEYILPYTSLNSYGFINNGERLNGIFAGTLDLGSAADLTECIKRYNHAIGNLRALNGQNRRTNAAGIYDLYVHGVHDCTDIAVWQCNILRACGIPMVVENVIGYRDFTGKHYHCSVYNCDSSTWHPFNAEYSLPDDFSFESPKCLNVYRHLYAAQKNTPYFLKGENEPVPAELAGPCIKDVTSLYRKVYSITLPCDTGTENNLAYLATFNAGSGMKTVTWGVIDTISRTVTFENTLPEILYMPVYYTTEGYKSFARPFHIVIEEGVPDIKNIEGIDNDTTTTTLYLTRKFPRKEKMINIAEGLRGGQFLGSNDYSFSEAKVLYTIDDAPLPLFAEYNFTNKGKFRYYRFQAPENNPHANISHLEWITEKSYGYENAENASRVHCLNPTDVTRACNDTSKVRLLDRDRHRMTWAKEYDGDMQTAPGAYPNITLTLDEAQTVTAVRFAPLNADNGIKAGNLYRLRYWSDGWVTAGIQYAQYEFIEFQNVPANKLYWIENLTEGKEEMPFVVIDGKQHFIYDSIITKH